jgi:hypothetical protein
MNEINNTSGARSNTAQRILTGIVALAITIFALLVFRTQLQLGYDPIGAIFGTGAAMVAILCWWFALRGHIVESRDRMQFTVRGGLILGGIGFVAGFIGPIILQPGANQGPLLGIFFTGPLGFTLGAAIGWIYGRIYSLRKSK